MSRTWALRVVFLASVLAGLSLAAFVGGRLGTVGGLVAIVLLMVLVGGFSGYGRSIDRGGGEGRPVSTDFGGEFARPPSEGDLL